MPGHEQTDRAAVRLAAGVLVAAEQTGGRQEHRPGRNAHADLPDLTNRSDEERPTEQPGGDAAERISVFLVDDHVLMRRGIRQVLESDGIDVVGQAASVLEAVSRIPAARPDVMLVDVRLPDGSGVDVCRTVRRIDPAIRALLITALDDETRAHAGSAGSSGVLLKDVEFDELVLAVRRVARGDVLDVPSRAEDGVREPGSAAGLIASLTPQERRVLALVADGMTNAQIGRALGISPKTAKNHVAAVLHKLNLQWRTQAAVSWARATSYPSGGRRP